MKSNQLAPATQAATPDEATRMTASWPDFLHTPIQTMEQAKQVSDAMDRLTVPAGKTWIAGRVATLLSQYFASSVPTEMMAAIADDWNAELAEFPGWAIQNSCRWWMGASNDKRRQKPMPGDIARRCKTELGVVKVGALALRRFEDGRGGFEHPAKADPCSAETAAQIVKMAGYAVKKFGGEAS